MMFLYPAAWRIWTACNSSQNQKSASETSPKEIYIATYILSTRRPSAINQDGSVSLLRFLLHLVRQPQSLRNRKSQLVEQSVVRRDEIIGDGRSCLERERGGYFGDKGVWEDGVLLQSLAGGGAVGEGRDLKGIGGKQVVQVSQRCDLPCLQPSIPSHPGPQPPRSPTH